MKLRRPSGIGLAACRAAVLAAAGAASGQSAVGHLGLWAAGLAAAMVALAVRRRLGLAALLCIAVAAGAAAAARNVPVIGTDSAHRTVSLEAVVESDAAPAFGGWSFVARAVDSGRGGARFAVSVDNDPQLEVGARIRVVGRISGGLGWLHRRHVSGRLAARHVEVVEAAGGAVAAANALRARVLQKFPDSAEAGALMRGFLIGDTSSLSVTTLEDMRRAGLLHFVAVSGGNVAIFLAGIWLLFGIIPMGPRSRAGLGLVAIGLFVLATRWEPSVVRAGLMAGLVLGGRVAGVPIDGWTALGGAATVLVVTAPQLVFDVGFQLSALATAGLLAGSHLWNDRRPTILWRSLGATVAAQLAVTPLLLWRFGSIPAFSAIANVLAAPLVALGTAAGWATVFTGVAAGGRIGEAAAHLVLRLSAWAAQLPQVGLVGLAGVVAFLAVLRWRAWAGIAVAVIAVAAALLPPPVPAVPTAVFLDVGQGDAVLLRSPEGQVVAVDTGPDPIEYADALRRHGIGHIDLLILTHSDGDHVGGLGAVAARITVSQVWLPEFTSAAVWDELLAGFGSADVARVRDGTTATVGAFAVTVLSPRRRYAADNDGSIVIWAEAAGATILLAGDIEAVAQSELPGVVPDVMLVPHHGSATTDLRWLAATVGPLAILSYGDNTYGHPAPSVIDTLAVAGTRMETTYAGDVVVSLSGGPTDRGEP